MNNSRLAVDKYLSGAITTLTQISGTNPEDSSYGARKEDLEVNGNMASHKSDEDGDLPAVTPSNYVGSTCANKNIFRVVSLNVQSMNNKFDKAEFWQIVQEPRSWLSRRRGSVTHLRDTPSRGTNNRSLSQERMEEATVEGESDYGLVKT